MGSAAEKLTKIERLNIAAKIAPWLRTLNKPVRRIGVVGPDGKVKSYTDTHAVLAATTIAGGPERFIRLIGKGGASTTAGAVQTAKITVRGERKQAA